MCELYAGSFVTTDTTRYYMQLLPLICRGLAVSYSPVHTAKLEQGTGRIRRHLHIRILFYLPFECIRHGVLLSCEMARLYSAAAHANLPRGCRALEIGTASDYRLYNGGRYAGL